MEDQINPHILKIDKAYSIFWIAAPIIFLVFLVSIQNTTDIQLHDTYFVISSLHLGLFFAILFGIFGFIYWLLRKIQLIKWMTYAHIICVILIPLTLLIIQNFNTPYHLIKDQADLQRMVLRTAFLILLMCALGQLLLAMNIIISLVRKATRKD